MSLTGPFRPFWLVASLVVIGEERTFCHGVHNYAIDPQRHLATANYCSAKELLDHLVRGHKKRLWHGKSERLCGLEVDGQVEFYWL